MSVIILPAGVHSLGFAEGVQFVEPSRPPVIAADDVNATTGEVNSLLTSIDPVDSAVIQIARTRRGSGAAVLDIGHRLAEIKKNDDSAAELAKSYAREMFAALVADGRIEIESIDTQQFGAVDDGLGLFLTYRKASGARRRILI